MKSGKSETYKWLAIAAFSVNLFFVLGEALCDWWFYTNTDVGPRVLEGVLFLFAAILIKQPVVSIVVCAINAFESIKGLFAAIEELDVADEYTYSLLSSSAFTLMAFVILIYLLTKYGTMDEQRNSTRFNPIFVLPAVFIFIGSVCPYVLERYISGYFFQTTCMIAGGIFSIGMYYYEESKPLYQQLETGFNIDK